MSHLAEQQLWSRGADQVLIDAEAGSHVRAHPARVHRQGRLPGALPWSGTAPPYAFGTRGTWLPQPADWAALTVARRQADPLSTLRLYRAALAIRRRHPALGDGDLTWLDSPPGVLAFSREPGFALMVNFGAEPVPLLRRRDVLLASGPLDGDLLPADTGVWLS
ncbi:DUF3459 domain-containing protein [Nonomuraea turkmeniaca]|uniref:DUF3459 domain-containing protein n=1 Tax=Nonomuraea turkmeniaca TaxID=103838 RepID=UPI001B87606E|nr:DUF3459 domain-containing protein [Nonomuraea turkmeniaca]